VIIEAPTSARWGTDATIGWTKDDGSIWVFVLVGHHRDGHRTIWRQPPRDLAHLVAAVVDEADLMVDSCDSLA